MDTICRKKESLFTSRIHQNHHTCQYLGPDGQPIEESYHEYLNKCSQFIVKARKYKRDNQSLKNSLLHRVKSGYEYDESSEEAILNERKQHLEDYLKAFDVTRFHGDPMIMYEDTKGQSKRIRIIRDIDEEKVSEEFSKDFYKGTKAWFTRYCALSKFVQAARMIVILNRLKKKLNLLSSLTPEDVAKFEAEEDRVQTSDKLQPTYPVVPFPCNYCPEDRRNKK